MAASHNSPVFWISVLLLTTAVQYGDARAIANYQRESKPEDCIKMTPDKEREIRKMASEVSEFLDDIAKEHQDFDIAYVRLDIERHRQDETYKEREERTLKIELSVKDCNAEDNDSIKNKNISFNNSNSGANDKNSNENSNDSIEHNNSSVNNNNNGTNDKNTSENNNDNFKSSVKNEKNSNYSGENKDIAIEEKNLSTESSKNNDVSSESTVRPVLYNLELDENMHELLELIRKGNKNKPLLAYVQPKADYIFIEP